MTEHTSKGRASLTALPAELLALIYTYTFSGCRARLVKGASQVDGGQSVYLHRCPLAIRCVNKSLYNDTGLLDAFFTHATLVVRHQLDVQALRTWLGRSHASAVRHLCVSSHFPARRSSSDSQDVHRDSPCRDSFCSERRAAKPWTTINPASLFDTFPGLESISTDFCGNHVDTTRWSVTYPLADLVKAVSDTVYVHAIKESREVDYAEKERDRQAAARELFHHDPHGHPLQFDMDPSSIHSLAGTEAHSYIPISTLILEDFRGLLWKSIFRYAKVTFERDWYLDLVQHAVKCGVEMLFKLTVVFSLDSEVERDCETVEDVPVSNRDWLLTLADGGMSYRFPMDVSKVLDYRVFKPECMKRRNGRGWYRSEIYLR